VLEVEAFVGKGTGAVDARRAGTVAVEEVAALDHEVLDDAVDDGPFVADGGVEIVFGFAGAVDAEVSRWAC
jgi:hypothetical protein